MPAIKDAVGIFLKALEDEGWTVVRKQRVVPAGPNPTKVDLKRGQESVKLLVYGWTTTHEGEGRPGPNQRVQWTPSNVVAPKTCGDVPFTRGRLTVGVGWWPKDEVFFAFDVWTKRLAKWSASIHVHLDALEKAHAQDRLVVDQRRWDPRIAVPASRASEILTWTRAQQARREALIKPVSMIPQGRHATIVGKVWGNTATSYLRVGDDLVLVDGRKLLDDSVWRIDRLTADTSTKPQTVTFACHRASRITDPQAVLRQFSPHA